MSDSRRSGCLKGGCIGCLGLMGLGVVLALVVGGIQFTMFRKPAEQVVEEKSQPLPKLPFATAAQLEDATGLVLPTTRQGDVERRLEGSGTLDLDLQMGEFRILPGALGGEIEIDAEYDRTRFRLVEELVERDGGDWTYKVSLKPRFGLLAFGKVANRVEIRIPRGRPMSVIGRIRMGQSELELGGLWLERFDVEATMGEHSVSFDEPTAAPLESFRLRGQMGELEVSRLGNASPRRVDLSHRMGQLTAGLEGAWQQDADVAMSCQMGECSLSAPDGVRLVADRASVIMGEKSIRLPDASSLPEDAPTLHLDVRGSMGEIRVR